MNLRWRDLLCILYFFHLPLKGFLQELPDIAEQNLESVAEELLNETNIDEWAETLEKFSRQPVNLNLANRDELREFFFLSDIHINQLISYRNVLGKFIDLHELQAIPGWDPEMIIKLIPYVTIEGNKKPFQEIKERLRNGLHTTTLRFSVKPKPGGEESANNSFRGSLPAVLFRYNYNHKNILYAGITADKDAGEQFLKGNQQAGFDFYSAHFYLKNAGKIKSLAIGDFTVNMGQGLIQWQGMAFRKSADAVAVKRQSRIINSYRSAGEFYFFRGIGLTFRQKKFESTFFISHRKIDSNQFFDSAEQKRYITSFLTTGLHRSASEILKKRNAVQSVIGGNLNYYIKSFEIGMNVIQYFFSDEIQKRTEPYNLFALKGKNWQNASVDYSYTKWNFHFFGEFALDKNRNKASLNGILVSLHSKADLTVLHRSIDRAYQSVNGNAFTENTLPGNEQGLYAGLTIRPAAGWRVDVYADRFFFPWIRYTVNAPSGGTDYALQVNYSPSKQFSAYSRFRFEQKSLNYDRASSAIPPVLFSRKLNWRTHLIFRPHMDFVLRARVEGVWVNGGGKVSPGYLGFLDVLYKPLMKRYSASMRFQYFETADYDSRVYAYENDVPHSYSVPSFSGTGYRYYLFLNYDFSKDLQAWIKIAATDLLNIPGNRQNARDVTMEPDFKLQVRYIF